MTQAAPPPIPPSAGQMRISPPEPGSRSRRAGLWPFSSPGRDGGALFAVPATPIKDSPRESVVAGLRARIEVLERHAASPALRALAPDASGPLPAAAPWTLGAPEIDAHLAGGLDAASLHELKPEGCVTDPAAGASAGAWGAALGFALRLAVRRANALKRSGAPAHILWCWPSAFERELGLPCGQGLAAMGLDPSAFLFVEAKRASEALWAMEEGLKSAEPRARRRRDEGDRAHACATLGPRRRRQPDPVPARDRSARARRRFDRHPLAHWPAEKRVPSLRCSRARRPPLHRLARTLPRKRARCTGFVATSGMVR